MWQPAARALDPALEVNQYAHTAWRLSDGFVKGRIMAIAQTRDGYLWLGTDLGLVRFDGVRAVPWQAPSHEALPEHRIRVLLGARDGTLWIGMVNGLASWDGARLVIYPQFASANVNVLIEDPEGTVWIGTSGDGSKPVGRLCSVRLQEVACEGAQASLGIGVSSIYEDSKDHLWVAGYDRIWRWRPGSPVEYAVDAHIPSLHALSELEPGVIAVATRKGVQQLVDGKLAPSTLPFDPQDPPRIALRDRNGAVWMGTDSAGLYHVHAGRVDGFGQADGLSGDFVLSLFEDREGSVWVATDGGLDRFHSAAATTYSHRQTGMGTPASVLTASDGSTWVSAQHALYRRANGHIYRYRAAPRTPASAGSIPSPSLPMIDVTVSGLPELSSASLHEDSQGRIWMGTPSGLGYIHRGRYVSFDGVPRGYIDAITGDQQGNLWIANRTEGLFRLSRDGRIDRTAWPDSQARSASAPSFAAPWKRLAVDPKDGAIWVATSRTLLRFLDGRWQSRYTARDGLGEGSVAGVIVDSDQAVWAATDHGASRLKNGRFVTLNATHGLPCDTVHTLVEDDDRALWLYMACGLVRISRADLDNWLQTMERETSSATVRTTVLDNDDGIRSISSVPTYAPLAAKSGDGRLWFVTLDGVVVVDPRHLPWNTLPPPVHVEEVVADRAAFGAPAQLKLPPLVRDLEIRYTALSLVEPEKVQFKIKLEGRDRNWTDVGNRRRAFYTDLAPKKYRFRVIAANNSGVWNEQGASFDFSIEPAYWQTNWFRALCVLALAALLFGLYLLRVRQLRRRFALTLETRVAERTRIARDLHDTLLQSFHGLLLRFQTVSRLMPTRAAEAKAMLDSTIEQAADAIAEGRDAVQALRTSTTEMNNLAASLRALGDELRAGHGGDSAATIRIEVLGIPRALHPIVRDEVFRIAAEALRNALRHAASAQIEVEIVYDRQQFRLRARDDGKGIDPHVLAQHGRAGHFGLEGMRERAAVVGGKLTVWSALDTGTEIELMVPGANAYVTEPPDEASSATARERTSS